jgi:hypothetical protein
VDIQDICTEPVLGMGDKSVDWETSLIYTLYLKFQNHVHILHFQSCIKADRCMQVAHAYNPGTQEVEISRMAVQSHRGQIVHKTLSWKKKKIIKIGLVECLKVKALSSSPSTTKKKKKKPVVCWDQWSQPALRQESFQVPQPKPVILAAREVEIWRIQVWG